MREVKNGNGWRLPAPQSHAPRYSKNQNKTATAAKRAGLRGGVFCIGTTSPLQPLAPCATVMRVRPAAVLLSGVLYFLQI